MYTVLVHYKLYEVEMCVFFSIDSDSKINVENVFNAATKKIKRTSIYRILSAHPIPKLTITNQLKVVHTLFQHFDI